MKIAFLLYEGMTALDIIGPHEILSRFPKAESFRVAKKAGEIKTDSKLKLIADYSLEEVPFADILIIPGAGNATSLSHETNILNWIRSIHSKTLWTTSVCTGSLILGAAGILSGLKATSHWAALDRLSYFGAKPLENRIVESGKVITAAGVSAGIDMALILAEKVVGTLFAQAIQLGIEYDPSPPFDTGSPKKANPLIVQALKTKMRAGFEKISK